MARKKKPYDLFAGLIPRLVVKHRAELKVLYTTGYTRNAVVYNDILDSGVAFLPKPFTIQQLAQKVIQMLGGAGRALSPVDEPAALQGAQSP